MGKETANIKDKFFFADGDAEYYDDTIELTVPYYQLVHKTMINILSYHFRAIFGNNYKDTKGIILDVGAGTGTESISALKEFPNMHTLAVDLCAPMMDIYNQNYNTVFGSNAEKRFKYVVEDIMLISEKDEAIQTYFRSLNQKACKVAISAYCIHHFFIKEKREIYQKMFDFLEPGGIFINMDLFNYKNEFVRIEAHEFDLEYIRKEFDNPSPQFANSRKISKERRELLKEKWLYHMNLDNILDPVEQHIQILEEIGFKDVECVFKYWQQGVLRARKPF